MRENDTNSKKSSRAILIVVAAVLLVAGGATYWFVQSSANKTCGFCQRPLEPHLSVTVEIAGHKKQVDRKSVV